MGLLKHPRDWIKRSIIPASLRKSKSLVAALLPLVKTHDEAFNPMTLGMLPLFFMVRKTYARTQTNL